MASVNLISLANTEEPRPNLQVPSVDYQDRNKIRDSQLKAVWDSEMEFPEDSDCSYKKASVLLLSWHEDDDDLETSAEVAKLEQVFKQDFFYATKQERLRTKGRISAQIQMNAYLANFLFEYDATDTLLIIYYGGHGRPRKNKGGLTLSSSADISTADSNARTEVFWLSAEEIVQQTKSDVLVIFDCCYASDLWLNLDARLPNRAFEYLAATSFGSTTKRPGPNSFTYSLTRSLSKLVRKGSFSTQRLVSEIMDTPGFPKDQAPRLYGRLHSRRAIHLSALNRAIKPNKISQRLNHEPFQDLLLRFRFDTVDESTVRELAMFFQEAINCNEIKAKAVSWEGIDTAIPSLSLREILVAGPALLCFQNILRQIRNRINAADNLQP